MSRLERLDRGRKAYAQREWREAYAYLSFADLESPLGGVDLSLLADSAYLLGGEAQSLELLERAYQFDLQHELPHNAARCAFWIGFRLRLAGDHVLGDVWITRARRQLEECAPCSTHGLLFLASGCSHLGAGDAANAAADFSKAFEIGTRFGDADVVTLARHYQGWAAIRCGRTTDGLAMLDESVATAASGTTAVVAGNVYCSALDACEETMDVRRAERWLALLIKWRGAQPSLVAFRAEALAHHVSLMTLRGAWRDALDDLTLLIAWIDERSDRSDGGLAYYQRGELLRLRGDHDAAESAYLEAAKRGHTSQPGLAQLWLAKAQIDKATSEIHRLLRRVSMRQERAHLLLPSVEILLAADRVDDARACAEELSRLDAELRTPLSYAASTHAIGAVLLYEEEAEAALVALRDARSGWQELGSLYHAARVQLLIAAAHRNLGNETAVKIELLAAASEFEVLGAAADRLHAENFYRRNAPADATFIIARQLEILRLLALGMSSAAIAEALAMRETVVLKETTAIYHQLRASTPGQAVERARGLGLI